MSYLLSYIGATSGSKRDRSSYLSLNLKNNKQIKYLATMKKITNKKIITALLRGAVVISALTCAAVIVLFCDSIIAALLVLGITAVVTNLMLEHI